jgi:hypothetical protein
MPFGAWLGQDAMNAAFPHARIRDRIRERGQKDDRKAMPGTHKAAMKLEPVNSGHHDVRDDTGYGIVEAIPVEKRAARPEGSNVVSERP